MNQSAVCITTCSELRAGNDIKCIGSGGDVKSDKHAFRLVYENVCLVWSGEGNDDTIMSTRI